MLCRETKSMANNYKSKKEWKFGVLFSVVPLFLWLLILFNPNFILLCISLIITALFVWIWLGTAYLLENGFLIYYSGPIRGRIPIDRINAINQNAHSWVGIRPALSFSYIKIRYNKYDDLFIAPKKEEQFIKELKSINPGIQIKKT